MVGEDLGPLPAHEGYEDRFAVVQGGAVEAVRAAARERRTFASGMPATFGAKMIPKACGRDDRDDAVNVRGIGALDVTGRGYRH